MAAARRGVRVWVRTYLVALAAAVAVLGGVLVGVNRVYDEKVDRIPRVDVDVAENTDPGEPANFLVIGSDTRAFVENEEQEEAFGDPTEQTGQRSDTIMVVQVDPEERTGLVVSFPRDLLVEIPGEGTDKINVAYNSEDGPNKLIETLGHNFGIPIHHYVEIDFSSFEGIVNAVGGVPVRFDAPAKDPCTNLDINPFGVEYPVTFYLDGQRALQYVRSRHYFEYDFVAAQWNEDQSQDLGRVERQQEFMRTLAVEAVSVALSNPVRGNRIANETLAGIKTDQALDRDDIDKLVQAFRAINPQGESLRMETFPWEEAGDGANLLPEWESAGPLLARLSLDPVAPPEDMVPPEVTRDSAPGAMATIGAVAPAGGDDPDELDCPDE